MVTGLPQGRAALYKVADADGVLLYVGVSSDPERRFAEHAGEKHWWPDVARRTIEWFSTRAAAEAAEEAAIRLKQPRYNVTHAEPREVPVTVMVPAAHLPGLDLLCEQYFSFAPAEFTRGDVLAFLLGRELGAKGLEGEPPCWHYAWGWPEGVTVESDMCGCGQPISPDGINLAREREESAAAVGEAGQS